LATKLKTKNIPPWADETKKSKSSLWILKKGKDFVRIEKSQVNNGDFYIQKDKDRKLTIDSLQARLTFHQLIELGYKLQK
tara:strand:- start:897 stop:1136 length:240 start_codon:yes stop_codon:yes gene_type:complete